jgi:hypothetical protein
MTRRLRLHPLCRLRTATAAGWLLATTLPGVAVDYEKEIRPLLKERCYSCHGALKQKGDLRLDTVAAMRKGGDGGDILAGGHALLVERLTTTDKDDRMPPEGEGSMLNDEQVAKIRAWIAEGAKAPANDRAEPDPRTHWAYQIPRSSGGTVDALLSERLAARKLRPQPEAAPEIWLRRVYLDLTGLPPTAEQVTAFARDGSMAARQRVVDHLLGTPQYGERWARHFMDIWRYCDWYGLGAQLRHSQKHLWHWRDWIVESLNADKGYDEMIVQMLAADELAPEDRDNLRATGFLARSYYLFNRTTWLDETIEHTCRAFLGLTMQCVKCHDHKYDPVDQPDYYRMRAIFEPMHVRLDPWPGEPDLGKNGLPRVFDLHLEKPTFRHVRGDEKNEDKSRPLAPGIPAVLEFASFQPAAVKLPQSSARPLFLPHVLEDLLKAAERDIAAARKALEEAKKALSGTPPASAAQAAASSGFLLGDDFRKVDPTRWEMLKGDWRPAATGLRQHETGAERKMLQLKQAPPADFEAGMEFTIRGGQRWKSVGLVFDRTEKQDVMVYMSAAAGGSKIQVALGGEGRTSYPPAGAAARAIAQDVRYKLDLRVRGSLINASINGEPVLAYHLPGGRRAGAMALAAFDCDVEFHAFRLSSLPADVVMSEPAAGRPASLAEARLAVRAAEKRLEAAQAWPPLIRAVFAAEQKRSDKKLAQAAAALESRHRLALAEAELAKAEAGPAAKDTEKKVKSAREAVDKARKQLQAPGEKYMLPQVSLKAQEGPEENDNATVQAYPETSTGRRLALARWIADRRNPLTARVLVNQVWMRHFGTPLVFNVDDFGLRSPAPLHQDVLDTLAAEFMNQGWSLKALHRALVLSELYRRSSSNAQADPATLAADPDNLCYWRMNPRRMESQMVRDSLLMLAGRLDLSLGGPGLDPDKAEMSPRRSLYFVQNADVEHRFLATFDNSNVLECYRRNESVVPQQALALTNSRLGRECAEAMAARLSRLEESEFIDQAFLAILNREPAAVETSVVRESLGALRHDRALLLQALLSHNDFVTLR